MVWLEAIAKSFISMLDTIKVSEFKAWINNPANRKVSPAVALYHTVNTNPKAREYFITLASTNFLVDLLECFRDKEVREWLFSDKNYNEFVDYIKSIHDKLTKE